MDLFFFLGEQDHGRKWEDMGSLGGELDQVHDVRVQIINEK